MAERQPLQPWVDSLKSREVLRTPLSALYKHLVNLPIHIISASPLAQAPVTCVGNGSSGSSSACLFLAAGRAADDDGRRESAGAQSFDF